MKFQKNLTNLFYVVLGLPSTAMVFALSVLIAVLIWILCTRYHLETDWIGIVWVAGPIGGISLAISAFLQIFVRDDTRKRKYEQATPVENRQG